MFRIIVLLVGGLAWLGAASTQAQDAVLTQAYGVGVHAYFSGDYVKTYEQLTAVIKGGSKDPRTYYFRGLAGLRLGRTQEAERDFQRGAELESRDANKFYNVSKSLERVQGEGRAALEKHRAEARMAIVKKLERIRKARYEALRREESRVLRQPPPPPESVEMPDLAVEPAPEPVAEPAADSSADAEEPPAAKPKKEAEEKAAEENPFAEEKKPAETEADSDDPFAQ